MSCVVCLQDSLTFGQGDFFCVCVGGTFAQSRGRGLMSG